MWSYNWVFDNIQLFILGAHNSLVTFQPPLRRPSSGNTLYINKSLPFYLLTTHTILVYALHVLQTHVNSAYHWCMPTSAEAHAWILVYTWCLPCDVYSLLHLPLASIDHNVNHFRGGPVDFTAIHNCMLSNGWEVSSAIPNVAGLFLHSDHHCSECLSTILPRAVFARDLLDNFQPAWKKELLVVKSVEGQELATPTMEDVGNGRVFREPEFSYLSLKESIVKAHGKDTSDFMKKLENTHVKLGKCKNHVVFNL